MKKHTDTFIQQTKTKSQKTLDFKMNKQMETFSYNPPIILLEEGIWLLAATNLEASNSIFNITDENISFSINIQGHGQTKSAEKAVIKLNKLLELRSQKGIELHVKEVRKRGSQTKTEDNEYILSDFGTQKNERLEEVKNVKHNDLGDLVFRFQLTYDEIIDILDSK